MSDQIPYDVENASTPQQIIEAAQHLSGVDSVRAIETLARLNRRASGWLVMILGFLSSSAFALIVFVVMSAVVVGLVWGIFSLINWFLRAFYLEWLEVWWLGWAILIALWLWRDTRLRHLIMDKRFRFNVNDLGWFWVALLYPFRLAAVVMRLCVALDFLTLMLSLPLTAFIAIARVWERWQWKETGVYTDLITLGFAAAGLYLLFGLWVFSKWPRNRAQSHSVSAKGNLISLGMALGLATLLGALLWIVSPTHEEVTGVLTAIFFLFLFSWFLQNRSSQNAFDFQWRKLVVVRLSQNQLRFLMFTLFVLEVIGAGVVAVTLGENWLRVRSLIPQSVLLTIAQWLVFDLGILPGAYRVLEGWIVGAVIAVFLGALAMIYVVGLGIALALPFAWYFFWLRESVENFLVRFRARQMVRRAIRHHRKRQRRLVAGRGDLAVCKNDLARFESKHASLSYGRTWQYWQCRVCKSDASAYTGVRVVRGIFDGVMTEGERQAKGVLLINLSLRADSKNTPMPLDLEEVHVEVIEDQHDIENFMVAYQNYHFPVKAPKINEIEIVVDPRVNLDENIERMLVKNFKQLLRLEL